MTASVRSDVPIDSHRRLADLDGPARWPLLGNLPQLEIPRLHEQLEAWAHRFGPLYRLRMGTRDVLVVARADLIATVLRDRPDGWRRMRTMADAIREIGGHGVFSAEGDEWRRQRRLVMSAFDPGHLKRFFPALVRVTERFKARLDTAADRGEAIDLQPLLMRYTVDVTAGLAFGADINTLEQPGDAVQQHLDKIFPMLMRRINLPFPYWRYVRLPSDRAFERHLVEVHRAVRAFIGQARERMRLDVALREHPSNLIEALIAATDEAGTGLSEDDLAGNVLTVLLAGEDTTANTLGWALHRLHRNRDAWQALVREVDESLGDADMPRSFEAARGLARIEDSVNEAMRLHPVAPVLYFENNRPTRLGGIELPEGTLVFCLTRVPAVDTQRVADAGEYRPERWRAGQPGQSEPPVEPGQPGRIGQPGEGTEAVLAGHALLKASTPFGAGPRLCPGRYLAMLEMKMVLATLARNHELIEVGTADGAPVRERIAFTMFPVALRLRIARR
ncbi:MAG: cytochrome P450 [Burkholderiaceae bacterium]|nr:cytochrome P450 [Burkholderiaceae bacterium]